MPHEQTCPIFEAGESSLDELLALAGDVASSVDPSCFTMLDAYAREEGSNNEAPKGIQVEANKVAGGNFFWAAQTEEIDYSQYRTSSTEGDLFSSGALGMGLDSAFLQEFLAKAVKATDTVEHVEVTYIGPLEAARGIISVKEHDDGLELCSFDLKAFGKLCGKTRNLVVAIPQQFCGKPIVRIAKDAFARPCVQGIDVALLFIPDSVQTIAQGALSCISARTIFLGSGVVHLGPQPCDLGLFSPKLKERSYVIARGNNAYCYKEGALLSLDEARLVFLEPPYADSVQLPKGIESIESHAFCTGTPAPSRVLYPSTLAAHTQGAFDRAVWIGEPSARLRDSFVRDAIRNASPGSIQDGECLYDIQDDGSAQLVAGPPPAMSASQKFAAASMLKVDATASPTGNTQAVASGQEASVLCIPRDVQGHLVDSIAAHALPFAPATVQLPSTLQSVGDGNTARGCKRIAIAEGVRRIGADCFSSRTFDEVIDIPASVEHIGPGSFQYTLCRFAPTGAILHIPADALRSPFAKEGAAGMPFDLEAYDKALIDKVNMRDRLGARIHRLAMPFPLEGAVRKHVFDYLEAEIDGVMRSVAAEGSVEVLDALHEAGLLEAERFDEMVERLRQANRMECVMYLLHKTQKSQTEHEPASARDRFAL